MSSDTTRVAPALLATLLGSFALIATAGAEPAAVPTAAQPAAAQAAADDCLAKPNGSAPQGKHWYYHVERSSGRHCWYLHAEIPKVHQSEKAHQGEDVPSHSVSARPAPARTAAPALPTVPAQPRVTAAAVDTAAVPSVPDSGSSATETPDTEASSVAPPASPASAPPPAWPSAAASEPAATADATVPPVQPSAADSQPAIPQPEVEAPPKRMTPRLASVEPINPVADPAHMPALLGIGLALAIIVLGSLAVREILKLIHWPRRRVILGPPASTWDSAWDSNWDTTPDPSWDAQPTHPQGSLPQDSRPQESHPQDARLQASRPQGSRPQVSLADVSRQDLSPDVIPVVPRRSEIARDKREPRADRSARPHDEPTREARREPAVAPSRETARALEDNVRALLGRLRTELPRADGPATGAKGERRAPSTRDAEAHAVADDLEAALEVWRARRRG